VSVIYCGVSCPSLVVLPLTCRLVQSELELNCWVTDEDHRNIFPIEIARTRTVGALKDAIKDKRKRAFEDVDSSSLVLWKVSTFSRVDEIARKSLMTLPSAGRRRKE
jgi:hypothetical protein